MSIHNSLQKLYNFWLLAAWAAAFPCTVRALRAGMPLLGRHPIWSVLAALEACISTSCS